MVRPQTSRAFKAGCSNSIAGCQCAIGAVFLFSLCCFSFACAEEIPADSELDASWRQPRLFDIPALPLPKAIRLFSAQSGIEAVADAGMIPLIVSDPVEGTMTPVEAMRKLLLRSRLAARAYGPATVILDRPSSGFENSPKNGEAETLFAYVQRGVMAALCGDAKTKPGPYRLALALRFGTDGAIASWRQLDTTGDSERDTRIAAILRDLHLDISVTASVPQPLLIVVSPEPSKDRDPCTSTRLEAVPQVSPSGNLP